MQEMLIDEWAHRRLRKLEFVLGILLKEPVILGVDWPQDGLVDAVGEALLDLDAFLLLLPRLLHHVLLDVFLLRADHTHDSDVSIGEGRLTLHSDLFFPLLPLIHGAKLLECTLPAAFLHELLFHGLKVVNTVL